MPTRDSRRWALLGLGAASLLLCPLALPQQDVKPTWDGSALRLRAGNVHFLSGRALDIIRNGRAVAYDFQLSLLANGATVRRSLQRFVISYDLWEERFRVTRLASGNLPRLAASNLTLSAAEAWAVENLSLATEGLASTTPYTVQLEVRAEPEADTSAAAQAERGISLAALVEIFSRPARSQQQKWSVQAAPATLDQMRTQGGR
ncbi:MAG: hypothetical protein JNK87_24755 [Bryobacterales bacterium]|nr:hypothetical protein [Bryobacterales bacterium]